MKDTIKQFVLDMGVDDVGVTTTPCYHSPLSPDLKELFPEAKSIIVLAYRELSSCDSPSVYLAMNGRMDMMEFSRSCNYKLARYLEKEWYARAMTVSFSYPLDMNSKTMGAVGELSLRHAAVAAGLGVMGRHNLVIHPRLGTRVLFTAVMTDLDLPADPMLEEDLCTGCDICVDNCPAGALDQEGKTDVLKCLQHSQPYGIGGSMKFWNRFIKSNGEEQKKMFRGEEFLRLYQAASIGFQYYCFHCIKSCPVSMKKDQPGE